VRRLVSRLGTQGSPKDGGSTTRDPAMEAPRRKAKPQHRLIPMNPSHRSPPKIPNVDIPVLPECLFALLPNLLNALHRLEGRCDELAVVSDGNVSAFLKLVGGVLEN
jgi:hypothetical protein